MASKQLRRGAIHLCSVRDPYGDLVYLVPTTSQKTWLSKALLESMRASCRWSDDLSAWLVDDVAYDLMTDVLESAAGHDEPWCADCVGWLDNPSSSLCETISSMVDTLEEIECKICHPEEEPVGKPGFKIPEGLVKLFAEEGSELSKFLQGRAKSILGKQAAAVGIDLPDALLDELLEAFFRSAKSKIADRATTMSVSTAAETLGVKWPCSKDDIITAFRKKARETHPDMGGSDAAFMKVNAAREVLVNTL